MHRSSFNFGRQDQRAKITSPHEQKRAQALTTQPPLFKTASRLRSPQQQTTPAQAYGKASQKFTSITARDRSPTSQTCLSPSSSNMTALVKAPKLQMPSQSSCAEQALSRWSIQQARSPSQFEELQDDFDLHMLKMGKKFQKIYAFNIYKLNKSALKIQHWFFKIKVAIASKAKPRTKGVAEIFGMVVADIKRASPPMAVDEIRVSQPEPHQVLLENKKRLSKADRQQRRGKAAINIPSKPVPTAKVDIISYESTPKPVEKQKLPEAEAQPFEPQQSTRATEQKPQPSAAASKRRSPITSREPISKKLTKSVIEERKSVNSIAEKSVGKSQSIGKTATVQSRFHSRQGSFFKKDDTTPVTSLRPKEEVTPVVPRKKKTENLKINIPPKNSTVASNQAARISITPLVKQPEKPVPSQIPNRTPVRPKSTAATTPLTMKKAQSFMVEKHTPKPQAKDRYHEYLEKMQKDIHDEKMKRFVQHTQELNKVCPESPPPKREIKRVDTGLRPENRQVDLEYRVSISPDRKRSNSKGFTIQPAQVNHFTGRRKTVDERIVDIEVKKEPVVGEEDDELYVHVGEHTQVFKYGNKESEKPELIDQYISYFKDNGSSKHRTIEKVTKSLVRNRSHSEDGFFKTQDRLKPKEAGVLNRGLIGASGTAPTSPAPQEVLVRREGSTKRLRGGRFGQSASFLETSSTPNMAQEVRASGLTSKLSFGPSVTKSSKEFRLEEAFTPSLGKPVAFGDLDVITETVPCSYMQPTKASLAAKKKRATLTEKREHHNHPEVVGSRKRGPSRNNDFNSPSKRPTTATLTTGSSLSTTQGSTQMSMRQTRDLLKTEQRGRARNAAIAAMTLTAVEPHSATKPQPRQTLLKPIQIIQ